MGHRHKFVWSNIERRIYCLAKWLFCKINQPILSPSLGGVCAHCHKHHQTKRVPDGLTVAALDNLSKKVRGIAGKIKSRNRRR